MLVCLFLLLVISKLWKKKVSIKKSWNAEKSIENPLRSIVHLSPIQRSRQQQQNENFRIIGKESSNKGIYMCFIIDREGWIISWVHFSSFPTAADTHCVYIWGVSVYSRKHTYSWYNRCLFCPNFIFFLHLYMI